jgi:hypothetical protein
MVTLRIANILEKIYGEFVEINKFHKSEIKQNNSFSSILKDILIQQKEVIKKQTDLLDQQLSFVKSQNKIIEKQKELLNAQISSRDNS